MKLAVQEIRDMDHRRLTMIHCHMDSRLWKDRLGIGGNVLKRGAFPMITGRPTAAPCAWWRRPDGSP